MEKDYDSASIWRKSRADARMSQEYLANYIGVSRRTIQNWECGKSSPDFVQGAKWFEAMGINPLPYFLAYEYPEDFEGIKASDSDSKIEQALKTLLDDLPIEGKRQLLFLFYGCHGSSPRAVLNLLTAHLQTHMQDRVAVAENIMATYEIEEATGSIVCPDHIKPDVALVRNAINQAKKAATEGKSGY